MTVTTESRLNARFTPLDHETLLQISGPDTLTFLQGQSTCDTGQLNETRALPGLFCNAQGRAYADFLLVQLDEEREDALRRVGVHVAGRLVRDHQIGRRHHGAGDSGALAFASIEAPPIAVPLWLPPRVALSLRPFSKS